MCCRDCLLSEPGFSGLSDFQDWEGSIHIPHGWGLDCWVLQALPISVNLRKDSLVVAQFIARLFFECKRRYELRDYEH